MHQSFRSTPDDHWSTNFCVSQICKVFFFVSSSIVFFSSHLIFFMLMFAKYFILYNFLFFKSTQFEERHLLDMVDEISCKCISDIFNSLKWHAGVPIVKYIFLCVWKRYFFIKEEQILSWWYKQENTLFSSNVNFYIIKTFVFFKCACFDFVSNVFFPIFLF